MYRRTVKYIGTHSYDPVTIRAIYYTFRYFTIGDGALGPDPADKAGEQKEQEGYHRGKGLVSFSNVWIPAKVDVTRQALFDLQILTDIDFGVGGTANLH